jgi:MtN3 and saliva related transmembrane protein
MVIENIVGYAATVIGTSMMVPQVIRLMRTKQAADLSLFMVVLYVANCALWFIYGWLLKAPPMILANGIGGLIGIVQMTLKIRYRNN